MNEFQTHALDTPASGDALMSATHITGLVGAARAWFVSRLAARYPKILVVCPTRQVCDELRDDLAFFTGSAALIRFPGWESLPFEPVSPAVEISAERISSALTMTESDRFLGLAPVDALLQPFLDCQRLRTLKFTLRRGDSWDRDLLLTKLDHNGFRRIPVVEDIGQYAVRGAIIDVAPQSGLPPIRLEFDGDVIRELRCFDLESQRSVGELAQITINPVREFVPPSVLGMDPSSIEVRLKSVGLTTEVQPRELNRTIVDVVDGKDFPGRELVEFVLNDGFRPLSEQLPVETQIVFIDEPEIRREASRSFDVACDRHSRLSRENHLLPALASAIFPVDDLIAQLDRFEARYLDQVTFLDKRPARKRRLVNVKSRSNEELTTRLASHVGSGKALAPIRSWCDKLRKNGFSIAIAVASPHRTERLQRLLLEFDLQAEIVRGSARDWELDTRRAPLVILSGSISAGCVLPVERLAFLSETEVFHERSFRTSRTRPASMRRVISTLSNLSEGDFVVHGDYGIGVYRGLKHLTIENQLGDFLEIDYADSKLYLPVQNIARIQKFAAADGQTPIIDKLGSQRWFRAKQKIRDSVITLAGDLIKLYAGRAHSKGWRFEPWGAEDERFADGFAYDETPDQLRAIRETIDDMANDQPMDRLVCGDVGFGKTEVAIRAAFKCTQHARQVAVLVPTTILVDQHYANFVRRFEGYPVKVGALSRFYSPTTNQQTLRQIASGEVDIIIGTHRLLQADVNFHDLGLVIIDEEHRFGVKQKERLKQMRQQVDVLTLTATPIPRTLHMSLLGIRDVSAIMTPPTDRRAVKTFIAERDDDLIRDALLREIRRGGQAFFLHNRVSNIEVVTSRLATLVPEARFDFAHGQMPEHLLEEIMHRFIQHKFDVLVTTTIIESGLDIPNANTMVIDRADQFGLAQLYQLRGRVGRSSRQAYTYLMVGNRKGLGTDAQKRLKVLQSLDDLGVGFNLAVRDLEIRGAGNLLGKEQSGSVLSVGYETYCKILQEAVAHLRGTDVPLEDAIDPEVKISGLDAYIPEPYIPDVSERLVTYQRLAGIRSDEEAFNLQREMEDRFGPLLPPIESLLHLMRFRSLLRIHGVVKAESNGVKTTLTFSPNAVTHAEAPRSLVAVIDGTKVTELVRKEPHRYRFSRNFSLSILWPTGPEMGDIFSTVRSLLASIRALPRPSVEPTR